MMTYLDIGICVIYIILVDSFHWVGLGNLGHVLKYIT